jgi:hypothetical protein
MARKDDGLVMYHDGLLPAENVRQLAAGNIAYWDARPEQNEMLGLNDPVIPTRPKNRKRLLPKGMRHLMNPPLA